MHIRACVGNYATTPYHIAGLEISVYCVEELCYCIREKAYLLDMDFMDKSLINWLASECGLEELTRELYPLIKRQGSLSAFISLILEYVQMYDSNTIKEVQQVLKNGSGLSLMEKGKNQVDYLAKKKKYAMAINRYDDLLNRWWKMDKNGDDLPALQVKAQIIHNKGVMLTRIMEYHAAAAAFKEAYDIVQDERYFESYLAAKRIALGETEYISFIAGLPERYEQSLDLERKMESLATSFEEQEKTLLLRNRIEMRKGSDKQAYYDENEILTQALKKDYRNSMAE